VPESEASVLGGNLGFPLENYSGASPALVLTLCGSKADATFILGICRRPNNGAGDGSRRPHSARFHRARIFGSAARLLTLASAKLHVCAFPRFARRRLTSRPNIKPHLIN